MIGLKLEQAKGLFFDDKKILDRAEREELRALAKFGAYVRRRARSSIRKRQRVSDPGEPPSSHVGLLRKFIFFFVEKSDKNVVIGPIRLNQKQELPTIPELLEYSGDAVRRQATLRNRLAVWSRRLHYRARPYMHPAFEAELPNAPELLRDKIKE